MAASWWPYPRPLARIIRRYGVRASCDSIISGLSMIPIDNSREVESTP